MVRIVAVRETAANATSKGAYLSIKCDDGKWYDAEVVTIKGTKVRVRWVEEQSLESFDLDWVQWKEGKSPLAKGLDTLLNIDKDKAKNPKQVLKVIGHDKLQLYRGDGYYYFAYDDPANNVFETHSVYVPRISDMTVERWVQDGKDFVAKVEAQVKERKANGTGLPKLTENESKMIVSVYNCHYGNDGDDIWSWAHNDSRKPHNLPKTTASGVIASLVKKGLMHSFNEGEDSTCGLTPEGQRVAKILDKDVE